MTFRTRRHHDLDRFDAPPSWQELARCAKACADPTHPARPDWWDVLTYKRSPEATHDNLAGIDVCTRCPVADECLQAADDKLDRYSIRAGMLPADWRQARRNDP